MIDQPVTISRNAEVRPGLNFNTLREEGLNHIQNLSSNLWTDFNDHDPGITIMEQLIYAITELSYRSNLDIKDILQPKTGSGYNLEDDLFTAAKILTNGAVTVSDYQKLVIDVPGMRNAYFQKSEDSELPVYVDTINKKLSLEPVGEKISIKGLYHVILDLDRDEVFGDMNSNILQKEFSISGHNILINFSFPNWFEAEKVFRTDMGDLTQQDWENPDPLVTTDILVDGNTIEYRDLTFTPTSDSTLHELNIDAQIITSLVNTDLTVASIRSAIENDDVLKDLILTYNRKLIKIWEIVDEVEKRLEACRNLCEDFFTFKNLETEDVNFCAQIEVEDGFDVSSVLGEIFYEIEQYLTPSLHFYSIDELYRKGKKTEEIFNGPILQSGFVDNDELKLLKDRKAVHSSDIINIIQDIPGVKGIVNLVMGSYVENEQLNSGVTNSIFQTFPDTHKFKLDKDRSSFIFYKDEDPAQEGYNYILTNEIKVEAKMNELRLLNPKVSSIVGDFDLPIPDATYRDLEDYYSIQEGFPNTYGVNSAGLKYIEDPQEFKERKAKAKQLKGYLMFSEQLLANFFSQLENVRELFSTSRDVDRTYFVQGLYDVPNIAPLLKDFVVDNPTVDLDDRNALTTALSAYATGGSNDYFKNLQAAAENPKQFRERRNRFLDHLLARFCEEFNSYTYKMFELFGTSDEVTDEIFDDKFTLLNSIPVISSQRFKAYNQKLKKWDGSAWVADVWNTENVSGYEKRLGAKLGIDDTTRRFLSFNFDERIPEVETMFQDVTLNAGSNFENELKVSAANSASDNTNGSALADWTEYFDTDEQVLSSEKLLNLDANFAASPVISNGEHTKLLKATKFGFEIPTTATIKGIEVQVGKARDTKATTGFGGELKDHTIQLVKDGFVVGDNKADVANWPTATAYSTYGNGTDLWNELWTPYDINKDKFGVAIAAKKEDADQREALIDIVSIKVYYEDNGVDFEVLKSAATSESSNEVESTLANWYSLMDSGLGIPTGNTLNKVEANFSLSPVIASTQTTKYLVATGFGINVPAGATITGIEAHIAKSRDDKPSSDGHGGHLVDAEVKLVKAGVVQVAADNKASGDNWPVNTTVVDYGGQSDLWGTTLTPADVNATNFGLAISVTKADADQREAYIDQISITVHFTMATGAERYSFNFIGGLAGINLKAKSGGYETEQERDEVIDQFIKFANNLCNFCTDRDDRETSTGVDDKYSYKLKMVEDYTDAANPCGGGVNTVQLDYPEFNTKEDRDNEIKKIWNAIYDEFYKDIEGIHLLEHILIRPKYRTEGFVDITEFHPNSFGDARWWIPFNLIDSYKAIYCGCGDDEDPEKELPYGWLKAEGDFTTKIKQGDKLFVHTDYENSKHPVKVRSVEYRNDNGENYTMIMLNEPILIENEVILHASYPVSRPYKIIGGTVPNMHIKIVGEDVSALFAGVTEFEIYNSEKNNGVYLIDTPNGVVFDGNDTVINFSHKFVISEDGLLPISLNEEDTCYCPKLLDPYSCRMTVILPGWSDRFKVHGFRRYAERVIRMETPAHIYPVILWASIFDMCQFEPAYKRWLELNNIDECDLTDELRTELSINQNKLIEVLTNMKTNANSAVLEDITEKDDGGEVLILGNTIIG